jgi:phosphoenolpyruvate synthase/pyruvate phosphate dikinase
LSGLNRGEKVVLVRLETSPEDITGMKSAQGILTVRGGMTSHAAVVARGMGECCVSGCGDIVMDEANKKFTLGGKEFHEGDYISIDGTTGNIYDGIIETVDAQVAGEFGRIMGMGGQIQNHEGPHKCGYSGGREESTRARRGGNRPLPYRAYVLRTGAYRGIP